jgi:hypothetical protein
VGRCGSSVALKLSKNRETLLSTSGSDAAEKGEANVKRILRSARPGALVALLVVAAIALFAAGSSGAAGGGKADLQVTLTSTPVTGTTVPYSTSAETAYVKYVITVVNNSKAKFTGVTMTDPATCGTGANGKFSCAPDTGWGGKIVVIDAPTSNCALSSDSTTVSCAIGNMVAGQTNTITLYASTPTAPPADCGTAATCDLINVAEAAGDEQFNDKPASHIDTSSATSDLPLTSDTTSAFTSVTLPNASANFFTDRTLGKNNVESSAASLPSAATNALVTLTEKNTTASQCSAIKAAINNTKLGCLPQVASVTSTLSPYTCPTPSASDTACLQMTFTVLGKSLPNGFKVDDFQVVHLVSDTQSEVVPLCPTLAILSQDCLSTPPGLDGSGNLVFTAVGPANGGWGGAG